MRRTAYRNWERLSTGSPDHRSIPILAYHKIDDEAFTPYWVSARTFKDQMKALKNHGYETVSLEDIHRFRSGQGGLPSKPVVLTFDEGFHNFYTKAYPILKKYGCCATNFLLPAYIGDHTRFSSDWELDPVEEQYPTEHLLWSEVREMMADGIVFGAHTSHHLDLTGLSFSQAENEIAGSKEILQNKLGAPVLWFSYPFSKSSSWVEYLVRRSGYDGAATITERPFDTAGGDLFRMDRITIYRDDSTASDDNHPQDFFMNKVDPSFAHPDICDKSMDLRNSLS